MSGTRRQVVLQLGADALVGALGVRRDPLEVLLELGVVVDVEVVGLVDVPLERVVPRAVLPEYGTAGVCARMFVPGRAASFDGRSMWYGLRRARCAAAGTAAKVRRAPVTSRSLQEQRIRIGSPRRVGKDGFGAVSGILPRVLVRWRRKGRRARGTDSTENGDAGANCVPFAHP